MTTRVESSSLYGKPRRRRRAPVEPKVSKGKRPREKTTVARELEDDLRERRPDLAPDVARKRARAASKTLLEDVTPEDQMSRTRRAARSARAGIDRSAEATGAAVRSVLTPTGARKTILGVMFLSVIFGVVRDVKTGAAATTDIVPRRIFGGFIAAILLMVLAGPLPRVARGLAFLVGFTVIAFNQDTISQLTNATSGGSGREIIDETSPTTTKVGGGNPRVQ